MSNIHKRQFIRFHTRHLIFLSILLTYSMIRAEFPPEQTDGIPVFPGAQGFGTLTKAGRGGKIIRVTNLNGSGAGSLKAALDASGPRIIVFEVGGVIDVTRHLYINNPFATIAGQTAPSPGITIVGGGIWVNTHDILMQHIAVRAGGRKDGPDPFTRSSLRVQKKSRNQ